MKTQIRCSFASHISIISLAAMFFFGACTKKEADALHVASVSKIQAPQMDIHTAVVTGNLEVLKQHIAAGSDLNVKDPFGGSTPLISASLFGKTEMAQLLMEAGADINTVNNDGSTALHTSAFFCRPEIVAMLLAKGANKSIKNNFGSTALESVMGPFQEVKDVYSMMGKMFEPMGLKLDFAYIEKTRPEIASMLN
jgi:uncharacterized protein